MKASARAAQPSARMAISEIRNVRGVSIDVPLVVGSMCRRRGAWLLRMPGADVLMAMPDRLRGARLKEKCEVSVESCVSGKPECANAANSEAACMQGGEARDFDWLSPNGIERHRT